MDPNETLRQMRRLAKRIVEDRGRLARGWITEMPLDDVVQLAEWFESLDEWMSRGGFPPEEWKGGA